MPQQMRQMGLDLARALVVLALLFLNFAHVPATGAAPGPDILSAQATQSWCGDAPLGNTDTSHAPCHACRIGSGLDLPPAPALAAPAPQRQCDTITVAIDSIPVVRPVSGAARPRAPPVLV